MTAEIPRDQQANIPNNRPEEGSASSDQLLVLKEELMQRFGQLPPHHQASVALVMLNTVADGELEERMREAITLRFPQVNPFAVGHDNLRQTHLREDQISKLSDQGLAHISRMLRQHYEQDVFL